MPITENTFTGDELKGALSANKDALLPIIKGVLGTDYKYVVQDEQEHATFKTNYENDVVARKTSEWATNLEKDVKELTGIDKTDPNEKYYDYFKRATKTVKESVAPLQAELDRLKKAGNPNAADQARIKQLEDAIVEEKTRYGTEIDGYKKKIHDLTVGNNLVTALAAIRGKYKKDIPPAIIETVEKVTLQELIGIAKVQDDGKVTYLDKDGKPLVNTSTYQPLTEAELLEQRLKDLIDTGRQQGGAGGGAPEGGGGAGAAGDPPAEIKDIPATVKTKKDLTDHLLSLGWTTSHPKWNETFAKFGAKLPLK